MGRKQATTKERDWRLRGPPADPHPAAPTRGRSPEVKNYKDTREAARDKRKDENETFSSTSTEEREAAYLYYRETK